MHCPRCTEELQETTKSGVLVDACPRCRGIWLDRGELEKLMGKAREYQQDYEHYYEKEHKDNYKHLDDHDNYHHKHHKKKGLLNMLENLFD
ncbi:MAG: hypothetical protein VR69_00075 [Peptococcaceae bacterium BRH_c4b]|nr:MAG: hypothetical protein VR69_00075 [Peptococcaceae bacterium BRH_c4b]